MSNMQTPMKRVRGSGAAGAGTGHFWIQRLTAVANVPLVLFLIVLLLTCMGADYVTARNSIANPLVAITLLLLVLSGVWHMCLGMQLIIEDYVHRPGIKVVMLILNILFSATIAVACLFAVLKISFSPQFM
ncbi:succinate dehydrogenase, hydrophobic membrane anchor protein [Mesorhizobium sp. PAMC28654]|uniref:succinate dehydrogenase, hydrophobic membrane anchor protein n=1 Tax=Mesorhizobium sp. PAMC28654 TaxID=2880934 RepID=UPI001D0AF132|nr:succinate dehydrogenase, hydrophobic membrane anchor protein [Mesorhizobium sp. PAMC28654]UDL90670.1 succinate dehydrogenase, hydrophobic membrane anchor protein [Mesorhizobium sp. PAMC28654]